MTAFLVVLAIGFALGWYARHGLMLIRTRAFFRSDRGKRFLAQLSPDWRRSAQGIIGEEDE